MTICVQDFLDEDSVVRPANCRQISSHASPDACLIHLDRECDSFGMGVGHFGSGDSAGPTTGPAVEFPLIGYLPCRLGQQTQTHGL